MALPTPITVHGTYLKPDGTPDSGSVYFHVPTFVRHGASDDVLAPGHIRGVLDINGDVTLQVPATDDPAWSPVNWTYRVEIRLSGVQTTFAAAIPYNAPGGELDLTELVPALLPSEGTLYAAFGHAHSDYATDAELAAGLAAAVDPAELTAALAGYATTAALAGYIDPTELAAALSAYLLKVGSQTFIGDLTLADAATAVKAYRLRSSGGSLDLETGGADLFLSAWSAANFSGTQRIYLRLEAGATLVHAVNRWIWATSASGPAVHTLDPVTGVASLGGKNGLTAIPFAGFKNSAGAPTTDTWALGDLVLDSAGVWHRCTAAGTPGTWT